MFLLIKWLRAVFGHDKYSAETIDRLIRSQHVKDLRWLASVTTTGAVALSLTIAFHDRLPQILVLFQISAVPAPISAVPAPISPVLVLISAVLAGLCGIIAWCYQTGSSRLGIVDLFACEITTLCRICTINGLADTCVRAFEVDIGDQPQPDEIEEARERFTHFDSAEAYTPIFDGNAKELRNLRVKVVTNITAFYTYWKATRDAFRKLAKTPAAPRSASGKVEDDQWHRAMRNVIYMQFLTCESARKAIRDLIEFEPNNAENTITVLLSELSAYGFLLEHFPPKDVRLARLKLRLARYRTVVPAVYYHTEREHKKYKDRRESTFSHLRRAGLEELRRDWDKAEKMLIELRRCYEDAIDKDFPRRDKSPQGWAGALVKRWHALVKRGHSAFEIAPDSR